MPFHAPLSSPSSLFVLLHPSPSPSSSSGLVAARFGRRATICFHMIANQAVCLSSLIRPPPRSRCGPPLLLSGARVTCSQASQEQVTFSPSLIHSVSAADFNFQFQFVISDSNFNLIIIMCFQLAISVFKFVFAILVINFI